MRILMKYVIAILLVLPACATTPDWNPGSVEPKSVEIRFLSDDEWRRLHEADLDCSDCEWLWQNVRGFADWSGDTCRVYFPASRGMPSAHVWRHEIHHCYEGGHDNW